MGLEEGEGAEEEVEDAVVEEGVAGEQGKKLRSEGNCKVQIFEEFASVYSGALIQLFDSFTEVSQMTQSINCHRVA